MRNTQEDDSPVMHTKKFCFLSPKRKRNSKNISIICRELDTPGNVLESNNNLDDKNHIISPPCKKQNMSESPHRNFSKNLKDKTIGIKNVNTKKYSKENSAIHIAPAKCVNEFAYKGDKNSKSKNSMEDFHQIVDGFMGDSSKGFFSIYDGHGGSEPAKYSKDRLAEIFSKFLIETNHNVSISLNLSFQKLDDELKMLPDGQNVGSTATVVYIYQEKDTDLGTKKIVYCANVGDSRCVLLTSNSYKRLSYDHKSTDEMEVNRIKKSGGSVFNGRVFGQLALTRALGDHAMKKYGVVCTPSIYKHVICGKDAYIVMCSDGVWDVLEEEDMVEMGVEYSNSSEFTSGIIKKTIERNSRDNISCIVIKL